MSKPSHFYGVIKPYRDDFILKPDEKEINIMSDHFNYLKKLLESKKLVLAGPTLIEEDPTGILIFEAESIVEARYLLESDPSVKAGIQNIVDLRPIRLSLFRPIL